MKNKLLLSAAVMSAAIIVTVDTPEVTAASSFIDVPETHPFYPAIQELAGKGIITGYNDGTFHPNSTLTREQAAIIIARALNLNVERNFQNPFADVQHDLYGYGHILALYDKSIINGISENQFNPSGIVTRGQIAKMLVKAFSISNEAADGTMPFTDVAGTYASWEIMDLYYNKITSGISPTLFGFDTPVTRGQMAQFIYKIQQLIDSYPKITSEDLKVTYFSGGFMREYSDGIVDLMMDNEQIATSVIVRPLKEGTAYFYLGEVGNDGYVDEGIYYKAEVQKINGVLQSVVTKLDEPKYDYKTIKLMHVKSHTLTDVTGEALVEGKDYTVTKNDEYGYYDILIKRVNGDFILTVSHHNGESFTYGIQLRNNGPLVRMESRNYMHGAMTLLWADIVQSNPIDFSNITSAKAFTKETDLPYSDYVELPNAMTYTITKDAFIYAPTTNAISKIKFYNNGEEIGEIYVNYNLHGNGYMLDYYPNFPYF